LELEEDLGGRRGGPLTGAAAAAVVLGAARNGGLGQDDHYRMPDPGPQIGELSRRIEALERVTARRERVFNQLMDLFAAMGSRR
jgi:hypothetical protein